VLQQRNLRERVQQRNLRESIQFIAVGLQEKAEVNARAQPSIFNRSPLWGLWSNSH